MDGLVAFLQARLDDDEQVVRRAPVDQAPNDLRALVDRTGGEPYLAINPSRVLAEVEAKRRIAGEYVKLLAAAASAPMTWRALALS